MIKNYKNKTHNETDYFLAIFTCIVLSDLTETLLLNTEMFLLCYSYNHAKQLEMFWFKLRWLCAIFIVHESIPVLAETE